MTIHFEFLALGVLGFACFVGLGYAGKWATRRGESRSEESSSVCRWTWSSAVTWPVFLGAYALCTGLAIALMLWWA